MSDHPHVNRTKLFSIIFAILLGLTVLSFGVANSSLMEQPVRGWVAMMIISIAKAMLVIVFFMHLKWETNWKFVLTIPAAVMSALLVLVLIPDIGNRTKTYSADREKFAASYSDQEPVGHSTKTVGTNTNQEDPTGSSSGENESPKSAGNSDKASAENSPEENSPAGSRSGKNAENKNAENKNVENNMQTLKEIGGMSKAASF